MNQHSIRVLSRSNDREDSYSKADAIESALAFHGDWENPGAVEALRDNWGHLSNLINHRQHHMQWCCNFRVRHPRLARWQLNVIERERQTRGIDRHEWAIGFVVEGVFREHRLVLDYPTADFDAALAIARAWTTRKGMTMHGLGHLKRVDLCCPGAWLPLSPDGGSLRDPRLESAVRAGLDRGIFPSGGFLGTQIDCL